LLADWKKGALTQQALWRAPPRGKESALDEGEEREKPRVLKWAGHLGLEGRIFASRSLGQCTGRDADERWRQRNARRRNPTAAPDQAITKSLLGGTVKENYQAGKGRDVTRRRTIRRHHIETELWCVFSVWLLKRWFQSSEGGKTGGVEAAQTAFPK